MKRNVKMGGVIPYLVGLASILLPASMTASATDTVLAPVKMKCDSAYYAKFSYDWTDAGGKVHNSQLTEVATDPYQIKAMIAEIYSNPKIPGKLQSTPVSGDLGTVTYSGQASHWSDVMASSVTKPTIDEQTMLLVELKDDFGSGTASTVLAAISKYIKSVRLVYSAFRIENTGQTYNATNTTYNPGVVYNVSGSYNRFYLMGKGSGRTLSIAQIIPFDRMFEQYSPAQGAGSSVVTDFYSLLRSGNSCSVYHDCGDVAYLGHYPTSTSSSSTTGVETMSDLLVYIPDYRLVKWSGRDKDGTFTYYNPKYRPLFTTYKVHLTAKAERKGEEADHTFNVTLSWTSNIDSLSDSRVKQDFYVYRVVDGVIESTPLNETALNDYSYTLTEPQYSAGHVLTYVVTSQPSGISSFTQVESNEARVSIPGYDPYELLDISGSSRSTYDSQNQFNNYTNNISVEDNELGYVTGDYINTGTKFNLYRFDNDATDADRTLVGAIEVGDITQVSDTLYHFNYTLKMQNQSVTVADSTGYFTASTRNGVLSFNGLKITDRFNASTASNKHDDHYDYVLEFMPEKAASSEGVKTVYSNVLRFNVLKTEFTVGMKPYTKAEVDADTDHSLTETGLSMTVNAANSSAVRAYTLYCDNTAFAEMQRASNGTYSILTRSDGSTRPDQTVAEGLAAGELTVSDELSGTATYYPVISSEYTKADGTVGLNTYGADQKSFSSIGVKVVNPTTTKTKPFTYDGAIKKMGFGCSFTAKAIFDSESMGQYDYHVWRVNSDGTETLLTENLYAGNNNPNVTNYYQYAIGDGSLTVSDLFIDDPLSSTESKTVNYIVRLYCQSETNTAEFYVAEDKFSVIFNSNTATGIGTVQQSAAEVSSVRYFDATGRQSLSPMAGFNIVVTTYTDGTVTTAKILR